MTSIRSLPHPPTPNDRLMITIKGSVNANPNCFAVNIQSGDSEYKRGDIFLHLSPVFAPPTRVVRNSLLEATGWGPEESTGWFPFSPSTPFEMIILVPYSIRSPQESFKIAINGTHFADFYPRVSSGNSNPQLYLATDGDFVTHSIDTNFIPAAAAPVSSVPPPYAPGYSGSSSSGACPYPTSDHMMPVPGIPTSSYSSPYAAVPPTSGYGLPPAAHVSTPYGGYPTSAPGPAAPYPTQPGAQAYPGGPHGSSAPGYPAASHGNNSFMSKVTSALPAALGTGAAAAVLGSVLGRKKHKKMKKGFLPGMGHSGMGHSGMGHSGIGGTGIPGGLVAGAAGAALGAYALHKANPLRKMKKMKKGFKVGGGWSSSSSSSSSD